MDPTLDVIVELPELNRESTGEVGVRVHSPSSFSRRDAALVELDGIRIPQGCAFIEDAVYDRLIYHKCDQRFLKVYRFHGSWPCHAAVSIVIFVLHALIFFEEPSSLSLKADIRSPEHHPMIVPFPITIIVEGLCLFCLALDCSVKIFGYGIKHITSYPWHLLYLFALMLGFAGWLIVLCFQELSCEYCKIRCFIRPALLLQHSALMQKAFICLVKAIPSIFSVFLLFFIHIVLFTLIGLVIMPYDKGPAQTGSPGEYHLHFGDGSAEALMNMLTLLTTANSPDIMTRAYNSNRFYAIFFIIYVAIGVHFLLHILFAVIFQKFREHFRDSMRNTILRYEAALVAAFEVLSDVDEELFERFVPAERLSKVIETISLKAELMAEVVSRFKNAVAKSTKITWRVFFRDIFAGITYRKKKHTEIEGDTSRNFDPLREHSRIVATAKAKITRTLPENSNIFPISSYFRIVFAHRFFVHFGSAVTLLNVLFIMGQYNPDSSTYFVEKETFFFMTWYLFEQSILVWALRPRVYFSHPVHRLDLLTLAPSFLCFIFFVVVYHGLNNLSFDDQEAAMKVLVGATHIFIGLRLLRVILSMKLPNLIFKTTADLIVNLTPFAGLLACLYYIFAVLGMLLFEQKIQYRPETEGCWRFEGNDSSIVNSPKAGQDCPYGGGYHQRDYWSENFDDFASSIVVLWNLMLINNWDIITKAFSNATNPWAQLYFVAWYVSSVGITLSLLTAVIVENFLTRWSIFAKHERQRKQQILSEKLELERQRAQALAERMAQGITTGKDEVNRRQRGKWLRKGRPGFSVTAIGSDEGASSGAQSVTRPTQSQPLSLIHVLDVKMPCMEEVRQHLALSPYSPTSFALNIQTFNSTYDIRSSVAHT